MNGRLPLLLLTALFLLLTGCLGRTIQVDAISLGSTPFPLGSNFIVEPLGQDFATDDLHFREFANHVAWALEQRGLTRAENVGPETVRIKLGYAMSGPLVTETERQVPVRGRVGSAPHTYYYRDSKGRERSRTVWEPRYGVVGYETQVDRKTEYACDIEILALAPEQPQPGVEAKPGGQLWKIRGSYVGSDKDLRLLFPRMLRTMTPHLGGNTGQIIDVDMAD